MEIQKEMKLLPAPKLTVSSIVEDFERKINALERIAEENGTITSEAKAEIKAAKKKYNTVKLNVVKATGGMVKHFSLIIAEYTKQCYTEISGMIAYVKMGMEGQKMMRDDEVAEAKSNLLPAKAEAKKAKRIAKRIGKLVD